MAVGRHVIDNILLDTASDPDDTTLLAAGGTLNRHYLQWVDFVIVTPQASSFIDVEDGVGGAVLCRQSGAVAGTFRHEFTSNDRDWGKPGTANTLLNATISGATGVVVRVSGEVETRGGS